MCLDNYVGIRGECQTATIYLDDLPGIDIVKAASITNETLLRPIDLVNKAFNQAKKEVLRDIFQGLTLQYNNIISSKYYDYAGNYEFYGLNDEEVKIKIYKQAIEFVQLHAFNFQIVSDRDATVDFVVNDAYNNLETIEVDLVAGFNKITLDKYTSSEFLTITFSLTDFKMGVKERKLYYVNNTCQPCRNQSICECSYMEIYLDGAITYNDSLGFNLTVRCEANECEILEYLVPIIDLPLLYKTGINYLLEAKMSNRINVYLHNKKEAIDEMLTRWQGGINNVEGINIPSEYWRKVKQVSSSIDNALRKLYTPVFSHAGSTVCNTLPG